MYGRSQHGRHSPSIVAPSSEPFPQFKNNYFAEMCSGSEASSYLRLIDFVYHSTLGLRVMTKKKPAPSLGVLLVSPRQPI